MSDSGDEPPQSLASAEYQALRTQIADADKTCVTLLGILLTATAALASFALEKKNPGIAFVIVPLWGVGHLYLAEKRFIILITAKYLRSEVEPLHKDLAWEGWLHDHRTDYPRYFPFIVECVLALLMSAGASLLARYVDGLEPDPHEPKWFWLGLAFTGVLAVLVAYSTHRWLLARGKRGLW